MTLMRCPQPASFPTAGGDPTPRERSLRPDLLAVAFCLLLPLGLYGGGLLPGRTIVRSKEVSYFLSGGDQPARGACARGHPDIPNTVYPFERFALDSLARGDSPFGWNPLVLCGQRNLVNSPIRSLFFWAPALLLPLPQAHGWMVVLLFQVMALFAYLWIRTLAAGPAAAAVGACGYALHQALVVWSYPEILESALWLPAILACLERFFRSGRVKWIGLGALAAGMQATAAHPQYNLYAWMFVAAYTTIRALLPQAGPLASPSRAAAGADPPARSGEPTSHLHRLLALSVLPLGFAVAGAHTLPFVLYQAESHRQIFTVSDPDRFRTSLALAASFWSPTLPSRTATWWWECCAYVGFLPLAGLAALVALRRRSPRVPRGLVLLGILCLLVIYDGPVSRLARHLPGLGISVLGRGSFVLALLVAGVGALGLDRLLRWIRETASARASLRGPLLALATLLLVHGLLLAALRLTTGEDLVDPEVLRGSIAPGNTQLLRPLVIGGLLVLAVAVARRGWLGAGTLAVLLVAVQGGDLLTTNQPSVGSGRADALYPPLPWAEWLAEQTKDPPSRAVLVGPDNSGDLLLPYGIPTAAGYTSMIPRRYALFFFPALIRHETHYNDLHVAPDLPPDAGRSLGSTGVRFLVSRPDLSQRVGGLREVPREDLPPDWPGAYHLYENRYWLPRVRRESRARWVAGGEEACQILRGAKDFHPWREVVLELGGGVPPGFTVPVDSGEPEPDTGEGSGTPIASVAVASAGAARSGERDPESSAEKAFSKGRWWRHHEHRHRHDRKGKGCSTRAHIVEQTNNRLVIETAGRRPGWVVLLDTWDPGWHATVDGRPAPAIPANFLFRAVAVPAGESRVVWTFQPAGAREGWMLTAAGSALALALACGSWVGRRVRRRRVR